MNEIKFVDADTDIELPPEFVCPYCGSKFLPVRFEGWTQDDDGTWKGDTVDITCSSIPDPESEEWEEWINQHTDMPYVYWMPVAERIKEYINSKYRFTGLDTADVNAKYEHFKNKVGGGK